MKTLRLLKLFTLLAILLVFIGGYVIYSLNQGNYDLMGQLAQYTNYIKGVR